MRKRKSDVALRSEVLQLLDRSPDLTQSEIARELGLSQSKVSRLMKMRSAAPLQLLLDPVFEQVPIPLYLSDLESDRFLYTNLAFRRLLHRTSDELEADSFRVSSLYIDPLERGHWVYELKHPSKPNTPIARLSRILRPRRDVPETRGGDRFEEFHLMDSAVLIPDNRQLLAIGTIAIPPQAGRWLQMEERNRALMNLIDKLPVGVHELDANGDIVFMNSFERNLLQADPQWVEKKPHVSELSPVDGAIIRNRVDRKLKHNRELADNDPRVFRMRPHEKKLGQADDFPAGARPRNELIGVSITDFPIQESNPDTAVLRDNNGMLTMVTHPRVPYELKRYFEEFGPKNPALEEVGISTMIVVLPKFLADSEYSDIEANESDEPCFVYVNSSFENDVRKIFESKGHAVKCKEDLLGHSQYRLWSIPDESSEHRTKNLGTAYAAVDRTVIETGQPDERIESHLSATGKTTWVQVIKFPHYSVVREDSRTKKPAAPRIIGVEAYFWEVGRDSSSGEELFKRLSPHRPHTILHNAPVPIWAKDTQLRFTYVNQAFIDAFRSDRTFENETPSSTYDARWFIGKREDDLFESPKAQEYEQIDREIITGKAQDKPYTVKIGDKQYEVLKSPITDKRMIIGVQGVAYPKAQ